VRKILYVIALEMPPCAAAAGGGHRKEAKKGSGNYFSGRSPDWLKFKNSDAPGVKREAEEGMELHRG
jgi:hypothetical protein